MPWPIIYLLDPGDIHPEPMTAPIVASIPKRRGQKYCVLYSPWERTSRISSLHYSAAAARKKAAKERAEFRRQYPTGFGHTWDACRFS